MIYQKDFILDNKILMRYSIDELGNKTLVEIRQGIEFKEAKKYNIEYIHPCSNKEKVEEQIFKQEEIEVVEPKKYQELFSKVLKDNEPKSKKKRK